MNVITAEVKKIVDPAAIYNDPYRLLVFGLPNYMYNQSISTKFSVSIILYFKSIDNLGTEIH